MADVIILTQENGLCAIFNPAPGVDLKEVLPRIAERNNTTDAEIVPDTVIPSDWTFRDAWVKAKAAVQVDMVLARDIWRDTIRQARNPKLTELDIEFQRCLEYGEDTSPIVAQKEALRGAPQDPAIDMAATPEELKAVWPAVLEEPLARSSASKSK